MSKKNLDFRHASMYTEKSAKISQFRRKNGYLKDTFNAKIVTGKGSQSALNKVILVLRMHICYLFAYCGF